MGHAEEQVELLGNFGVTWGKDVDMVFGLGLGTLQGLQWRLASTASGFTRCQGDIQLNHS